MLMNMEGSSLCINNSWNFMGGNIMEMLANNIEFITISTTGNATDFGDLTSSTSRSWFWW